MNIALTGATGYIGGAVLDALIEGGTTVTAVVRSEVAADTARAKGAEPVVMDLIDRGALRRVLSQADGAVHAASPGDATSAEVDSAVVDAVIEEFSRNSQTVCPHQRYLAVGLAHRHRRGFTVGSAGDRGLAGGAGRPSSRLVRRRDGHCPGRRPW